jgi:foldase protein PrsA
MSSLPLKTRADCRQAGRFVNGIDQLDYDRMPSHTAGLVRTAHTTPPAEPAELAEQERTVSRWLAICSTALLVLAGCQQQNPQAGTAGLASPEVATMSASRGVQQPSIMHQPSADSSQAVAFVNGRPITLDQLRRPVFEAHGLQFLLHLVQLEMARQKAAILDLSVDADDIAHERTLTLEQLFGNSIDASKLNLPEEDKHEFVRMEEERLLAQFLALQRISQPEFELALQTGAHLRKIAQAQLKDRISEENLREAFSIEYGEKVRVRHIQVANLREAAEARRRIDAGEAFEQVARELSRNNLSRQLGGEIRPFSRSDRFWPVKFVEASFELKNSGDLSDIIHTGDAYHLLKLEERIAPRAVKFEDHKEIIREKLYNLLLQVRSKQLREELAAEARNVLRIEDSILRRQYQERMERAAGESGAEPEQIRRQIELDASPPTTPHHAGEQPGGPEVARPPAIRPGN